MLGDVHSSLKVSGLPRNIVSAQLFFLNHMIVHKYMINTELYLPFWKYVDKLFLEKNLDKSANIPMNSQCQSAVISINSQPNAPITTHTNQNWFISYISKYYVLKIFTDACFFLRIQVYLLTITFSNYLTLLIKWLNTIIFL